MSDSDKGPPKQRLFTLLILVLIVFTGIQTWYMMEMRHQLDDLLSQQSATPAPAAEIEILNPDGAKTNAAVAAPETAAGIAEVETPAATAQIPRQETAAAVNRQTPAASDSQAQLQPRADNSKPAPVKPRSGAKNDFFSTLYDSPAWDPYEEIERMRRDIDSMFNRSYNRPHRQPYGNRPDFQYDFHQDLTVPEIDIKEDRTQYIILVNLPGADKNDVSVSLDGQRLTIKGKRKSQKQRKEAGGNIVIRERRSGNFRRSITLAEPVIEGGMKTGIKNGVLTIVIPKYK